MSDEEFARQLKAAITRVAAFDKADLIKDRSPQMTMAALEAGIRNPSSGAHFDAYAMLDDLFYGGLLTQEKSDGGNGIS